MKPLRQRRNKKNVANISGCWFRSNNRGTYGTPAVLLGIGGTHISGPGMLLVHENSRTLHSHSPGELTFLDYPMRPHRSED